MFYIVRNADTGQIKFGITSGRPGPRLADHRAAGYRERVLVLEGLPGTLAPEIERAAIAALELAGVKPLRGREHFGGEALAIVVDIAAGYAATALLAAPGSLAAMLLCCYAGSCTTSNPEGK